jgi:uncharacterized damage-inducible protein DinB
MRSLLICLLATAAAASAQDNPLSAFTKRLYARDKSILLRSAEKVPEDYYSFRPTDAVRSFGQLIGHLADGQYEFCSPVVGGQAPEANVEKTKTSKADLIAALKEAFAYCDKAYDGLTDANAAQTVKFFGREAPKMGVLIQNSLHNQEHYGNLVTYMRLKNIVPPTSERAPAPPQKKQ